MPLAGQPLHASVPRRLARRSLPGASLLALLFACIPSMAQEPQGPEVIRLPAQEHPKAAQAVPRAETIPPRGAGMQEALADLWLRRKAFLEKNDLPAARRQVDLMRDILRREGSLSASETAGAFLAEGNRALEARNRARALESFHLASEFSPDDPGAYFGVARTLWSQEKDLVGAATALFQGLRAASRNPGARTALIGDLLLTLLLGSLAASCLWILLGALRTLRLGQHDLYEKFLRSLSAPTAQAAAWAVCLLPALLWLSGWWLLVYLLLLSLPYLSRSERLLSLLASLCLVAVLPVLAWIDRATAVATDPTVRILLESSGGGADPERISFLEQAAVKHPSEPLYHFLLAQSYRASGSLEAALQEYRQVQSLDPGHARAWINSGNLFFSRDQFAQAAQEYSRAIEGDPGSAIAHYNLSLALQAALKLEEADRAFSRARELDNALVTSILASGTSEGARVPLDARISAAEILAAQRESESSPLPRSGWTPWISPLTLAGLLGVLGSLTLGTLAARWGFGRAQRCRKCGEPFCRKCQVGMRREEGLCTACRRLFVLKDKVAAEARAGRERRVASHERWEWISRRLVSLVLPGAGQIRGGRTLWGALLLWTACTGGAALLLAGRTLAYPGIPVLDGILVVRLGSVALIALAWLAANSLAFEKRG